jgi:hypothetical protein
MRIGPAASPDRYHERLGGNGVVIAAFIDQSVTRREKRRMTAAT